ncbi:uncharacterized protein PAC_03234 [Phialocephala subalpina]|uniref:Capsule polysaccharide biosynthesis protein n=1 Tax=Phialocephala subalpina TaxID=576137 RepID=A0A1L7WKQ2_9HELO|nr:uncharacterized protein PAC_03234 [Phialocephala subalpina]
MARTKFTKVRKVTSVVAVITSIATAVLMALKQNDIRIYIVNFFIGPGYKSRILLLIIALLNIKNLPMVWHYRMASGVFRYMIYGTHEFNHHPHLHPRSSSKTYTPKGPSTLFLPIITSTHSPLWETDFNLHKSNSTYFSDLDVSRHHLVACLFREGLAHLLENDDAILDLEGKPATGHRFMMVGSVSCSFKREIKPYVGYEVWSRVLCWDRKWIYVVSHFVKKGTAKPRWYVMQESGEIFVSIFGGGSTSEEERDFLFENGHVPREKPAVMAGFGDMPDKAIYASGIVRYVVKSGGMTVHPNLLLAASGLLPPRPGGWEGLASNGGKEIIMTSEERESRRGNEWDWRKVEAENSRGLKLAQHLDALEGTHCEWSGSKWPALDRFRDLF